MPIETLSAGSVRDKPEVNSDEYDIGTVSGGGGGEALAMARLKPGESPRSCMSAASR
jgi:hypothetical protein